ncbi:hypothetical protein A7P53_07685 [Acinetobacter defluvii]|uniref:hypothetical protein n=1 Tax=Acinetobacter defluvii TaxID=1871111 RepID=UPI00148F5DE6|nr:hypothetical protein [Acinetobacter defluvii]NNP72344.1 hypothetical protein [Acinetobacter defluvii]
MKKVNKSCLVCFSNNNDLDRIITNFRFVLESFKGLEDISIWARLASALTNIQFDSYEHQEMETYLCDLYEYNREDDKYYEEYMKHMTRFIYLYNILEYIAPKKGKNEQPDMPSFRKIIETYPTHSYPLYISEYCKKYMIIIKRGLEFNYLKDDKIKEFIINNETSSSITSSFFLLTNMRNLLAHGKMKVIPNPDFTGKYEEAQYFSLLFKSSTIILISYIHLFIINNFKAFDAEHINIYREDFDIFPLDINFYKILQTNHLLKASPLLQLSNLEDEEEDIFEEINLYF